MASAPGAAGDVMEIQMGPSHPASHGTIKFNLRLDGETILDVEVVFLYPWAVTFRPLGMFGFVEMAIFVLVLALGFVYVWRKGALEWS